jgi:hypothetical protein
MSILMWTHFTNAGERHHGQVLDLLKTSDG